METTETITLIFGLIMLAASVLQIVLFFKIWGMTNNVKRIADHLMPPSHVDNQEAPKQTSKAPLILMILFACFVIAYAILRFF